MGKFTKPIGYIEKVGRCIIKKVSGYGKKYIGMKVSAFGSLLISIKHGSLL